MNLTVEEMKEAMMNRKSNTLLEEDTLGLIKGVVQGLTLEAEEKSLVEALIHDYERLTEEFGEQLALHEDDFERNPMMKVNNRKSMLKVIQREWEGSKRYHSPTSLIVFSVDELDEEGNEMAEAVKHQLYMDLSEIINKSTRLTDTFGRIDDEKFVIVVPTTNNLQAAWLSTKLRDSISAHDFGLEYRVSCSFGVADSGDSMDVEDWLVIGEEAYNKAVELGGNRVVDYATIIEK